MLNKCYDDKHKWLKIATFKINPRDFDEPPSDVLWCAICGSVKTVQTGWGITKTIDKRTPEITEQEMLSIKAERNKGVGI